MSRVLFASALLEAVYPGTCGLSGIILRKKSNLDLNFSYIYTLFFCAVLNSYLNLEIKPYYTGHVQRSTYVRCTIAHSVCACLVHIFVEALLITC